MYTLDPEITTEYLLKHLTQEQIMEHYLGLPIKTGKKFSSPFRDDKDPSCSLSYRKGKLKFRDFGANAGGDCFDVAMMRYGTSYGDTLREIARDFGLIGTRTPRVPKIEYSHLAEERENGTPTDIRVRYRKWMMCDKKYWYDKYGLTRKDLEHFNIRPVQVVWVNDLITYNSRPESDPCYAYRLGKKEYKLYFPMRGKEGRIGARFMQNTDKVQGWRQLPRNGKYVVMTKSMKDVVVLYKFGVPAIALISESFYPPDGLLDVLRSRFEHVLSLYDFDHTGIKMANYLKREYGVTTMMLDPSETGAKDIADYREVHGERKTAELISLMREYFDEYFERKNKLSPDGTIPYM